MNKAIFYGSLITHLMRLSLVYFISQMRTLIKFKIYLNTKAFIQKEILNKMKYKIVKKGYILIEKIGFYKIVFSNLSIFQHTIL